jgi:hypothetical protein
MPWQYQKAVHKRNCNLRWPHQSRRRRGTRLNRPFAAPRHFNHSAREVQTVATITRSLVRMRRTLTGACYRTAQVHTGMMMTQARLEVVGRKVCLTRTTMSKATPSSRPNLRAPEKRHGALVLQETNQTPYRSRSASTWDVNRAWPKHSFTANGSCRHTRPHPEQERRPRRSGGALRDPFQSPSLKHVLLELSLSNHFRHQQRTCIVLSLSSLHERSRVTYRTLPSREPDGFGVFARHQAFGSAGAFRWKETSRLCGHGSKTQDRWDSPETAMEESKTMPGSVL